MTSVGNPSSSSTSKLAVKSKAESVTSSSPSVEFSDPSSMAIAPYVPPTTLFPDFNLPFTTDNDNNGLWGFDNTDGGGVPFISGSQLEGQQNALKSTQPNQQSIENTASGSTSTQIPTHIAKNNPFLNKLRSMVDDPATNDLICWSKDGETFLVPNHVRFGDEVLPRFFKHNRFSSFVRQLNMYGFHKVPHLQQGALKSDLGQENELWEFKNENFQRDRPELLLNMQRKKGVRNDEEGSVKAKGKENENERTGEGGTPLDDVTGALMRSNKNDNEAGLIQMASVWSAIQSIQAAQQGINDDLRHLHNSNSELFREAAEQRARSQKQEETINKMLRFLAGVFGAQDIGGEKRGGQSSSSASGGGTDSRRRRVVVRPNFTKNNSGRLTIEDGGDANDQIEELEVPMDEESQGIANIEELPAMSRSNSNSPNGGTTPISRFNNSNKSPEMEIQDLPSISSEVTATPGGGRRISQQAGSQIINALANGDGSAWLASLFGQQQQNQQQSQSNNQTSGSGAGSDKIAPASGAANNAFKFDAQTLAALQSVLGSISNNESAPGNQNSYFGGATGSPRPASASIQNNSTQPAGKGASVAASIPSHDSNSVARLSRNYQNLQGSGQDAAMVQSALNALLEGLRTESGNTTANTSAAAAAAVAQSAQVDPVPKEAPFSHLEPTNVQEGSDVDMDQLLKEFLESSASSGSNSALTPTAMDNVFSNEDGLEGQTPDFVFSPNGRDVQENEQERRSSSGTTNSEATSPRDSPAPPSKKRKPAAFEGALGADIERANAKAVKNARKGNVM